MGITSLWLASEISQRIRNFWCLVPTISPVKSNMTTACWDSGWSSYEDAGSVRVGSAAATDASAEPKKQNPSGSDPKSSGAAALDQSSFRHRQSL